KVIVDMNFTQMQFNAEFDDNAFDLKKNMTSATMKLSKKASGDGEKNSSSFQVFYPTERLGAKLASAKKAMTDDGKKYVFQYTGENSFTLVEQNAEAWSNTVEPASVSGTPVNLGFAIGHMTNNSISWTYQGTDFFLASKNLKPGQMVDVARSVFATKMK
ncbi:MAG TPA: outer membrane lipoprotein carrier protein LolA, partial [Bacillales bacterium]